MSAWFRFGASNHLQVEVAPQRSGCGSTPMKPQPTFESEDPPEFACRACLLVWMEGQIEEEPLDVAIARGYRESD